MAVNLDDLLRRVTATVNISRYSSDNIGLTDPQSFLERPVQRAREPSEYTSTLLIGLQGNQF